MNILDHLSDHWDKYVLGLTIFTLLVIVIVLATKKEGFMSNPLLGISNPSRNWWRSERSDSDGTKCGAIRYVPVAQQPKVVQPIPPPVETASIEATAASVEEAFGQY